MTWKKQSHVDEPSLRGCIGNFSPLPLHDALKDYALISAIQDRRFDPIDIYELDELQCTVSLLTDFEPAAHAKDWEVSFFVCFDPLNILLGWSTWNSYKLHLP